jgi:hypothetical protein
MKYIAYQILEDWKSIATLKPRGPGGSMTLWSQWSGG